jgi:hypothetical protein
VSEPLAPQLVPPQPNLGPEPWPEPAPWLLVLWVAAGLFLLVLGVLAFRLVRSARRRRRRRDQARAPLADATPRNRLVTLSDTIRDDLSTRFGTSWRAKTTEELAVDGQLEELLGAELFPELIGFLDQVDRLKFATERASQSDDALAEQITTWEPRVTVVRARILERPERRARGQGANRKGDNSNHRA